MRGCSNSIACTQWGQQQGSHALSCGSICAWLGFARHCTHFACVHTSQVAKQRSTFRFSTNITPCLTPVTTGASLSDLSEADCYYLSDDYKASVVSHMSTSQLIEICLINPTVTLTPSYRCASSTCVVYTTQHNAPPSTLHRSMYSAAAAFLAHFKACLDHSSTHVPFCLPSPEHSLHRQPARRELPAALFSPLPFWPLDLRVSAATIDHQKYLLLPTPPHPHTSPPAMQNTPSAWCVITL